MKKSALLLLSVVLLWSCGKSEKEECVFTPDTDFSIKVNIEHFEDTLANLRSREQFIQILRKEPLIRDYVFSRQQYPSDSTFVTEVYEKLSHPAMDTLLQETHRVFGNGEELEREFSEAFTNMKYYYPDFTPPKVKTVISGIETDLFVSDSVIIVGLDFYLGKGAKFRPKLYEYLLRRYEPEDIVPSCMLIFGISPDRNKTNVSDKTVLADMIAYGKSFYFAKHMLPCTPDSVFLWYTTKEIAGARANEDLIWTRLIQDKILYSTNMIDKRNYLGERPVTIQVGEKCPGRIAQWTGWQIVRQYMAEHRNVSLPELMEIDDAQRLFKESAYKPKKR